MQSILSNYYNKTHIRSVTLQQSNWPASILLNFVNSQVRDFEVNKEPVNLEG